MRSYAWRSSRWRGAARDGKSSYTSNDIKAAYYQVPTRRRRRGRRSRSYWVDDEYHSHANYVPREALETCPLTQRANAPSRV